MIYVIFKQVGDDKIIKEFGSTANEFFTLTFLQSVAANYGGDASEYLLYILPETSEEVQKIKDKEKVNGFKIDKELKLYALVV